MLIEPDSSLYVYAITRDFGFAPNPFHGLCTLATCKPGVRKSANVGDWILGVGGSNMHNASRKCILLMKITSKISFQEYWDNPIYSIKKPLRNGSRVRMLGDNIYHKNDSMEWVQEDSHHSSLDGTTNHINLARDTKTDKVLISTYFLYFGAAAISLDLNSIGFNRIRNYIRLDISNDSGSEKLITSIVNAHRSELNMVISDPCQFKDSHKRVDQATGKIS